MKNKKAYTEGSEQLSKTKSQLALGSKGSLHSQTQNSVESLLFPIIDMKLMKSSMGSIQPQAPRNQGIMKHLISSFSNVSIKAQKDEQSKKTNLEALKKYTKDIHISEQNNYVFIDYDSAATQITQMEDTAPLFKPINKKTIRQRPKPLSTQNQITEEDQTVKTNELKLQYIRMIKEGGEDTHLQYLLSDYDNPIEESFQNYQFKVKQEQILQKLGKAHKQSILQLNRKFREMDDREIQSIKDHVRSMIERGEGLLPPHKEFSIKDLGPSKRYKTKEEQAEFFKQQGEFKSQQIQNIQQRKNKMLRSKIEFQQQKQLERSLEYRLREKEKQIQNSINVHHVKNVVISLNIERILKLLQQLAEEGLNQKRLLFKEHMKARVIQHFFRKNMVLKKIAKKFTQRQRLLLRNLIFFFRVRNRIKAKQRAARLIILHQLRQEIVKHFQSKLMMMLNSVRNIQILCKWYNHCCGVYMSILNQKWDTFMLSQVQQFGFNFQFQNDIKDPEHKNIDVLYNFPHYSDRYQRKRDYLLQKPPANGKLVSLLQLRPQLMLHTYELKFSILKKIESQRQQEDEVIRFDKLYNDVLLPYTKHQAMIDIKQLAQRVKLDIQVYQQVEEKIVSDEIRIKIDILRGYLRSSRRNYALSIRDYYNQLLEFKQKNAEEINTERIKLLLKTKVEDLKLLAKQEKEELSLVQQKRKKVEGSQFQLKRKQKVNVFSQFHDYQHDHLPFGSLTLKITEYMYNNKPRFRVKLNMETWKKLFQQYHTQFKARYEVYQNQTRLLTQSQIKTQNKRDSLDYVIQ